MTPREVMQRHTSQELSHWQAFFRVEPTGWDALNTHQAALSIRQSHERRTKFEDYLLRPRAAGSRLESAPELSTSEVLQRLGLTKS